MSQDRPKITLPLSQEYRLTIADVIAQWAYFEAQFDFILWLMLGVPASKKLEPRAQFPLALPFGRRRKLFGKAVTLCFSQSPKIMKRLRHISSQAKKLRKTRDHVAHCYWAGSNERGVMITIIHNARADAFDFYEIGMEYLTDTAAKISALSFETRQIASPREWLDHPDSLLKPDEITVLREVWRHSRHHQTIPKLNVRPLLSYRA